MSTPTQQQQVSTLRRLINVTHQHGVALGRRLTALAALNRTRRTELAKLTAPARAAAPAAAQALITMYDDVTISLIPSSAVAVAGYVNGPFANFAQLVHAFPRARHVSIAVTADADADCLDVETGDASPQDAPGWVKRQHARGIRYPKVYANASTMPAVQHALTGAGIPRSRYRLWVAQYDGLRRVPAGYDAHQLTDTALGRSLDESVCLPTFFD